MGAAAIAARLPLAPAMRGDATVAGLAFDELGGPVIAACGMAGGAGTSTLALTLARCAAAASGAPVLLTEADPVHAGLAALTGTASPHPLVDLACRVADDAAPAHTFAELECGLRLVATHPQTCATPDPAALEALLAEARAAHGLVIVDHGTSWSTASPVVAAATHILWSVPATRVGLARAHAVMTSDAMPPAGAAVEVLVATATATRPGTSVRALRRLAARRCERLVLIGHSDAAARGARVVDESVARALTGLATTLRRWP